MAVPQGAVVLTTAPWLLYSLAGSQQGCFQDRGLSSCGTTVGQTQEQTSHELRQTVPIHSPVLQEGHHEKDREVTEAGVSVLPSLLFVDKV
jgi:hypothetical protein